MPRLIDADAEIATVKENICKNCNSHNGEAHMKEKIISQFQSLAGTMPCITLVQAIKMVEDC